ncbi:MAG: RDD family protein, partial [Terriglobales bacterium]
GLDAMLVGMASIVFALSAWGVLGYPALDAGLASLRHWLPALVGVPELLAAMYLLLCAHLCGPTLGMRWRGLRVVGLDGPADAAACRRRGWASVLSLGALGVGFVWMYFDPQHLSWHDAISRTCISSAPVEAA